MSNETPKKEETKATTEASKQASVLILTRLRALADWIICFFRL